MEKVIVTTVTYNSSQFLERLVKSIDNQTYKAFKIICVDNNSNSQHKEKIRELCSKFEDLIIVDSNDNLGGAGGFQKAFEYALKNFPDTDWFWIMDDDAFPQPNCLKNLLKYKDLPKVGCLCPLIYGNELKEFQLYHHKYITKYLDGEKIACDNVDKLNKYIKIDANAFVGPLVNASIIDSIGIPDGNLFIYGDDTEYTYRISRKYNLYLIKDAVINHRDVITATGEPQPKAFWKDYYMYRNKMLFIDKYSNGFKKLIGKFRYSLKAYKAMLRIRHTYKDKRYKSLWLKCISKGLNDGRKKITGKTLDPSDYFSKLNMINK